MGSCLTVRPKEEQAGAAAAQALMSNLNQQTEKLTPQGVAQVHTQLEWPSQTLEAD